ncbi:unnamed protein product [Absidia cylindrospora]
MSPPTTTAAHRNMHKTDMRSVDRCSTIRACEPCRRRKRLCNGQKPCSLCKTESNKCVYSVISDHPRGVFTTNTARRLSSGSACETCRRRKTKCDGSNPCAFCAANNLKCINNAERRKRASISVGGASSSSTLPSSTLSISSSPSPPTSSSSPSSTLSTPPSQQQPSSSSSLHSQSSASMGTAGSDHEAIDRIEDRLRRIEQLMTVFTPSPLSQSTVYSSEDGSRRPYNSTNNSFNIPAHFVRQQRHSVQGITVAKEQMELQMARRAMSSSPPQFGHHSTSSDLLHAGAYITPPNSGGKKQRLQHQQQQQHYQQSSSSLSLSASPPSSPEPSAAAAAAAVAAGSATMLRQSSNPSSQPLTSSMLNLTLSPSSSTSSSSNTSSMQLPQSSMSTPLSDQPQHHPHPQQHLYGSFGLSSHHHQQQQLHRDHPITSTAAPPMPSLMDQLSKRTFAASHSDYPVRSSYPIYPLSPSPPIQLPPTTTYAEASFSP